jgi:ribosome biogenesis GTPase / thiamine phosphate phosphatase
MSIDNNGDDGILENDRFPVLKELGWDSFFENAFQSLDLQDKLPARVIAQERDRYKIVHPQGEAFATLSGRALYHTMPGDIRPTVGDWVAIRSCSTGSDTTIEAILTRKSKLSRQIAGGRDRYAGGMTQEQVVAANVDTVFIVCSLNTEQNISLRKLERYLALVWSTGAIPAIILNKIDLYPNVSGHIRDIEQIAVGTPVIPLSATKKLGMKNLGEYLSKGKTAVFLGPSGVGKSYIINAILGAEILKTAEVRESDFRGRHTTTRRELFLLPRGGMVIDTPGMREIQLWGDEDDISGTFRDVEQLALECRFRDCSHRSEPGCAVKKAIDEGKLDNKRLNNYWKMQLEIKHMIARQNDKVRVEEKLKWKKISQWQKKYQKDDK